MDGPYFLIKCVTIKAAARVVATLIVNEEDAMDRMKSLHSAVEGTVATTGTPAGVETIFGIDGIEGS